MKTAAQRIETADTIELVPQIPSNGFSVNHPPNSERGCLPANAQINPRNSEQRANSCHCSLKLCARHSAKAGHNAGSNAEQKVVSK
jgi:hypothetical protein